MDGTEKMRESLPHHGRLRRLVTAHPRILGDVALLVGVIALVIACCGCSAGGGEAETGPADAWEATVERGTLRVGTEGTYSPYSYHDDSGKLTGYDIELVQAVADKLGVEAEFSEMGFDGLAAGLDVRKFDVVADQICITPERQEKYLFSKPYAYVRGVVITRDDSSSIKSFDDLDGKTVALTLTSNWAKMAEEHGATVVSTEGFSESMQMVVDGRVDATVNDNLVFLDYMGQHPDAPVKVAAQAEEGDVVALMMRGGDEELQGHINDAMADLAESGFLEALSDRYFGEDITHPAEG